MNKPQPIFKLPPTGRMSDSKPEFQFIGTPPRSRWSEELEKIKKATDYAKLEGKVFEVSRQLPLRRGDLVEWSPTGARGLWRVTDVSAWKDAGDLGPMDFATAFGKTTEAMSNEMADEIDRQVSEELGARVITRHVPKGKVRLEWFAGWCGYANDRQPVTVKIEEVRKPTEMEVLALAAQ